MSTKNLDCHFTWNLEENVEYNYMRNETEKLRKEMEMNPDLEARGLITMAYFYAMNETPQLEKSLQCLEDALNICDQLSENQPEHNGYKIVALGNKAHILELIGNSEDEIRKIVRQIDRVKTFSANAEAGIQGLKGFTMLSYTSNRHQEEGKRAFETAIKLDPENFEWYLGMGIVLKRLRFSVCTFNPKPTDKEEEMLTKAVELTGGNKSLPLVLLADVYFYRMKNKKALNSTFAKKAKRLYEEAYELSPNCIHVLKRCGKAFAIIGDADLAEECLLKALELDQNNSVVMHRLGKLYWRSSIRDLEKAEDYFVRAVSGKDPNFFAEMDLAKLRKIKNTKYDTLKHFKQCRNKYKNQPKILEDLDKLIYNLQSDNPCQSAHYNYLMSTRVV